MEEKEERPMIRIHTRPILYFLALLCLAAIPLFPQPKGSTKQFVLDPDKFFVYLRFDHIGPGAQRSDDEPPMRIWLHLVNNCRVPIVFTANGVPDESPKDEVGLRYRIVANPPVLGLPHLIGKPSGVKDETDIDDNTGAAAMPRNDLIDAMSAITVEPGEAILFSMPINHLGKHWHVEIPFEFDVPRGKCCRDEKTGGQPVMVVDYGLYDLPSQAQKQVSTK